MTDYRYASGEEPRAGDIVRSLADKPAGPRKTGDVFTVQKISPYGNGVYYAPRTHGEPATFELIARAGEPVRYQPGDVVEFVSAEHAFEHTRHRRVGDRFTVPSPAYADKFGRPGELLRHAYPDGHESHAPASYFKLVHRPAKTEPLAFTPPEPQVGDRVRVTVEGTVRDLRATRVGLHADYTVEIIERAEKPLAVGDRVAHINGTALRTSDYRVRLIEKDQLVLQGSGSLCVVPRADWKRVS